LEAIAAEKAGIFKPRVPAISGVIEPELDAVLRGWAEAVGAPFSTLEDLGRIDLLETGPGGTRFRLESGSWGDLELRISFAGGFQARNAWLAAELLAALPAPLRPAKEELVAGFAAARWPGRLQVERIRGTTWVF